MHRGMAAAALALALAAALAGCGTARFVVVEPAGGVVAIPANIPRQRLKAEELMAGKCPGGYDITREEEWVVGQRVSNEETHKVDTTFKEITTTKEVSVRDRTEWRIHFRCR